MNSTLPTLRFNIEHNPNAQDLVTFQFNHESICTQDNLLTVGNEYQYKRELYLARLRLLHKSFDINTQVQLDFTDEDRSCTVTPSLDERGSDTCWHLYDKDYYRLKTSYLLNKYLGKARIDKSIEKDDLLEFED
jgi:hypothetical protein